MLFSLENLTKVARIIENLNALKAIIKGVDQLKLKKHLTNQDVRVYKLA